MHDIEVIVKEGNPVNPAKPKSWRISLPANVAMKDLLNAMIPKLGMPMQQRDGYRIVYKMHHVQSGNTLSDNDTMKGAGVADRDIIELQVRSPRSVAPKTTTIPKHKILREEIKAFVRSHDPESSFRCPICNNPVKVKNLLRHFNRMHGEGGEPVPAQVQLTANEYYDSGLKKWKKSDYQGAIVDFTETIRLDPQFAEAYYQRGLAHKDKGDLDWALSDYTRSIELNNPDPDFPYYGRGIVRYKKGDLDGAIVDFNKAIRHNPKYPEPYIWLGAINRDKGNFEQAIANFKKYREMGGDKPYVEENIEECKKKIKNSKRWWRI